MATVVWHGFHSFSEQQKAELPPPPPLTALRLKLAPPKPTDLGGWSFLPQSLSVNSDVITPEKSNDGTGGGKDGYAPRTPSVSNSVKLSDRSLEMCTENLGCETGSDVISNEGDTNIYPSFMSSPSTKSPTGFTRQHSVGGRKVNSAARSFPPPLTTMCGAERVLVRSHRVEGRLVMVAVKSPYSNSNFLTERSHGRLRLSLLRTEEEPPENFNSDKLEVRNEKDEPIKTDTTLLNENVDKDNQIRKRNEDGHEIETASTDSSPINSQNFDISIRENIREEENTVNVELMGGFQRPPPTISRCKEGEHEHHHHHRHHHQSNISLWVATS